MASKSSGLSDVYATVSALTDMQQRLYVPTNLKRDLDLGGGGERVMTTRPPNDPLKELGGKIDAIREARKPKPVAKGGKFAGAGFGWRMTVDLVTGVCVGAAIGWGLDSLFGSKPLFLIVFILLGFAAGVRVMLKSAEEFQKDQARPDPADAE